MSFKNLFKSLTSTSSRRRPSSARLCLEALEDRTVPSYSVIDLGPLRGGFSQPTDINASAQVVGTSYDLSGRPHAFLWQNGIMTDLATLDSYYNYSEALGINDAGQIVGKSLAPGGVVHAFLLTPEDTDGNGAPDRWFRDSNSDGANDLMLDLGTLGGSTSSANDVNNAGQVVGSALLADENEHAFAWDNGVMTDLCTLGGLTSSASAINDAGQVTGIADTPTGEKATFLWQGGAMHDLGASWAAKANDINQSGQVAGSGGSSATLWTPTTPNGTAGSFTSLGALPPDYFDQREYSYIYSFAASVNDLGAVVGSSRTTHGSGDEGGGYYFESSRGFLWSDGVMEELPVLQNATATNNAGQIVGNGPIDYTAPWNSAYRAYLLTPGSAAMPLVTIDDVTITEGNTGTSTAVLTVRLSEASSQTMTVDFATANDSATAGSDYQPNSGTLTFTPGQLTQTISVPVVGDRLGEPNETFVVNLSSPTNATIADGQAVGTILDDEPRISIGDVTKAEGKKGQKTLFTFTVTLSAAYDQAVTMSFRTVNGTAKTNDNDYVARTGTLTFAPGETTKTITIEVKGDSKKEANETFYLDLFAGSSNSLFTKNRGIGTIFNDD